MSRYFTGFVAALALLGVASTANATAMFSGSSNGLSASASFTISGNTLTILLTNTDSPTGGGAPDVSSEVLTGLFFNLGTATFTPISANGSIIQTDNCDLSPCAGQTGVGGEWGYAQGGSSWFSGTTQGIGSAGTLGSHTKFGGTNYEGPPNGSLNGVEFGIVPDGWTEDQGNNALDAEALIAGTVQFVLQIPNGVTLQESDIKNVYFTYGTSTSEPKFKGGTTTAVPTTGTGSTGSVPEPALLSMLGLALVGVGVQMRRRRQPRSN
jgi:hypothetical protein